MFNPLAFASTGAIDPVKLTEETCTCSCSGTVSVTVGGVRVTVQIK